MYYSLKMYNFNPQPKGLELPEGFTLTKFVGKEDIPAWLAICGDGLVDTDADIDHFDTTIVKTQGVEPYRDIYFIEKDGEKVATFAAVPNMGNTGMGNLHMVACKTAYRGLGIGKFMGDYCLQALKNAGVEKVYLLTDDFRIPAIKSYLSCGYLPVDYENDGDADMITRWQRIVNKLEIKELPILDEDGDVKTVLHAQPKVRIGVLGGYRGESMIKYARTADNAVLVAVCDFNEEVLHKQRAACGEAVAYYSDFEDFIKHPMDAVVLANYANEHAPFAIRCLKAGLHVFSEVLPVQTMKEAVELIEAVEETGKIYAYGENYCYMPGPYELRKLYKEGKIGEFEYGEGEYVHNCEPIWPQITYGDPDHWRNNMYANFYCTHSIGPLIHITGLRPVQVTGFESKKSERKIRGGSKSGLFGMELIELENGGIIKSIHGDLYKDSIWYSVYGSLGRMETAREDTVENSIGKVYLNFDAYDAEYNGGHKSGYYPEREFDEIAKGFGHGNSDFYTMYNFVSKVQGIESADTVDVYEALDMFLPGMLAYRSVLNGGIPMEIPNLRNKEEREKWRNDTACTDPKTAGEMLLPVFSAGNPDIPDSIYEDVKEQLKKVKAEEVKKTGDK